MKKFKQTNMKDLLPKLMSAFNLAKGKKPVVIILSIVAVAVLYYAVHKGWISSDIVSIQQIVDGISSAFPADSVKVAIDTIAIPVDTLTVQVVDSITAQ